MTHTLPAAGVISAYEPADSVGRIELDGGGELRFGGSACVGFTPSLGQRVFVIAAVPHPLGGWRASIVNTTGAPDEDRITLATRKSDQDEQRRLAWLAASAAKKARLATFPTPRLAAASDPRVLGILESLRSLESERLLTPAAAKRLPLTEHLAFEGFEWTLDVFSEAPLDPFFFAFGGADGDSLGVYLYPPALDQGEPAPVVHYFHEHDPIYTPLAASVESFIALLRTKKKKGAKPLEVSLGPVMREALALGEGDAMHTLVARLFDTTDPRAVMAELQTLLEDRGWTFQATQCRYRHAGL